MTRRLGRTDLQNCCCCAWPAHDLAGPTNRTDGLSEKFRPAAAVFGRPATWPARRLGRTDFQTCCCCAQPAHGPAGPSTRTDGRTFRPAAAAFSLPATWPARRLGRTDFQNCCCAQPFWPAPAGPCGPAGNGSQGARIGPLPVLSPTAPHFPPSSNPRIPTTQDYAR
jgi:hypothetical protein